MKQKKRGAKAYISFVIVAIIALVLANPKWLPLSESLRASLAATERSNLILNNDLKTTAAQLITVVLACCIVWLLYRVLCFILRLVGKRGKRAFTITEMCCGLLKYLAVIVAVIWSLTILGVDAGAVLAGVGIIGLIIGFGAQSLIEDIITGAFIIFEDQYSVGDIIVLDDVRGTVRSIGVRTTVIEDDGGNLKVVNNSDIRNFQNRSRNPSLCLCLCGVAYGTDLRKLEKVMEKSLPGSKNSHPDLYLSDIRYMGVDELADSGVVLKFSVQAPEDKFFPAQRMLARDVKLLLDDNDFEIPFPQVVVHRGD
ncbi:MAG: mechanosensitive ion channel family protein [Oscillospiraceae bacterium]|nr:mechanosensitive ion channel family protein [Oscillospiraceae bacterium]